MDQAPHGQPLTGAGMHNAKKGQATTVKLLLHKLISPCEILIFLLKRILPQIFQLRLVMYHLCIDIFKISLKFSLVCSKDGNLTDAFKLRNLCFENVVGGNMGIYAAGEKEEFFSHFIQASCSDATFFKKITLTGHFLTVRNRRILSFGYFTYFFQLNKTLMLTNLHPEIMYAVHI
uniref:Uncharacterized protein n=1 Tax=Oryza meridionalis TaxID=40149 RepID=A0A0E0F0N8_9ORYZ